MSIDRTTSLRAELLLLLTALIWGFAFVAQRVGIEYIGPYLFNAARFALGCLPLIPFVMRNTSGPLTAHLLLRGAYLSMAKARDPIDYISRPRRGVVPPIPTWTLKVTENRTEAAA